MKMHVLRMKKNYGCNVIGEVCGFAPDTAAHILKHDGAEQLAVIEQGKERFDLELKKVVSLAPAAAPAKS